MKFQARSKTACREQKGALTAGHCLYDLIFSQSRGVVVTKIVPKIARYLFDAIKF
jgi:hypothetical protein